MPAIRGRAFAKVNLGLRILARRPDGFHELRTVFQTISLADQLVVRHRPRAASGVRIVVADDPQLANSDNLAVRAAEALLSRGKWKGRVEIELEKRIPAGAGLGGGSSDAGAVLLALERLLRPAPALEDLHAAAAEIGSDVPFFLLGGRALGVGRGEEVYPLPELPRRWMVLLAPAAHVSTIEAYQALANDRANSSTLTDEVKCRSMSSFCSGARASNWGAATDLAGTLSNDFEPVIFRRLPELRRLKGDLLQAGAQAASLSGSGSAIFGLFETRAAATAACRLPQFSNNGTKAWIVRTTSRRDLRAEWRVPE